MVVHQYGLSKEVLYIGSAVPLETSVGLEAVQQPLRTRYPISDDDIEGIPSILTILPKGIELKYMDDPDNVVFFPFTALNLCAAVRCVTVVNDFTKEPMNTFVSLTQAQHSDRPAIFTTITRKTTGRNVLECSGFLTKNPQDALELVQWTSAGDKKSKMSGGVLAMSGTTNPPPPFQPNGPLVTSHTPVNIVAGNSTPVKPGSYDELPRDGYFYTTDKANPRKFSLHRFVAMPGPPPASHIPPAPASVQLPVPEPAPPSEVGDRRSVYSMPVMPPPTGLIAVPGPPPPPAPVPVMMAPQPRPVLIAPPRPPMVQPMMVRPMMFGAPPPPMMVAAPPHPMMVPRPAFIPARPGMIPGVRPMMPMMMPVPMAAQPPPPPPRSSSSDSSSSVDSDAGQLQISRRDRSIRSNSRPATPPRDYDLPRFSRHDQFQMMNGFPGGMVMMGPRPMGPRYAMMPGYPQNGGLVYGPPLMNRSQSVPPHQFVVKKDSKKKSKKKSKRSTIERADLPQLATSFGHDSDGPEYQSDLSPSLPNGNLHSSVAEDPHFARSDMYGMSRMSRNMGSSQYRHEKGFSRTATERAFSSSLAAETRRSNLSGSLNAYSMNHNGHGDTDFPLF